MKYRIKISTRCKRQLKKYKYMPKVLDALKRCVEELADGTLSPSWWSHKLQGDSRDLRELHVFPDVLLIYGYEGEECVLIQIGSHSDLFG